MEIIIVSGLDKRLALTIKPVNFVVGLLIGIFTVTGLFQLGIQYESRNALQQLYSAYAREVNSQREQVHTARFEAQQQLEFLSRRVSDLHNDMIRLNAVGKHITKMAGLEDFDFESFPTQKPRTFKTMNQRYAGATVEDFLRRLDDLSYLHEDRKEQLLAMQSVLMQDELYRQLSPGGRPVAGSYISSLFGLRKDPFSNTKKVFHEGLDLVSEVGAPVVSVAAGVVTWSGERYGYGNTIEIKHGYGYVTRYAHNKENLVGIGDVIEKGQLIALLGASGRATGPHLHYEVIFNGVHVDPKEYLRMN